MVFCWMIPGSIQTTTCNNTGYGTNVFGHFNPSTILAGLMTFWVSDIRNVLKIICIRGFLRTHPRVSPCGKLSTRSPHAPRAETSMVLPRIKAPTTIRGAACFQPIRQWPGTLAWLWTHIVSIISTPVSVQRWHLLPLHPPESHLGSWRIEVLVALDEPGCTWPPMRMRHSTHRGLFQSLPWWQQPMLWASPQHKTIFLSDLKNIFPLTASMLPPWNLGYLPGL